MRGKTEQAFSPHNHTVFRGPNRYENLKKFSNFWFWISFLEMVLLMNNLVIVNLFDGCKRQKNLSSALFMRTPTIVFILIFLIASFHAKCQISREFKKLVGSTGYILRVEVLQKPADTIV